MTGRLWVLTAQARACMPRMPALQHHEFEYEAFVSALHPRRQFQSQAFSTRELHAHSDLCAARLCVSHGGLRTPKVRPGRVATRKSTESATLRMCRFKLSGCLLTI